MRLVFAILALSLIVTGAGYASEKPTRVLSMNVCADQYLIALADKDQIVALSNYARSRMLSYYAARADTYPTSAGSVEEVLALQPDLIVSGALRYTTMAELRKRNFRILEIKPAESYNAIVEQIRLIADAIGQQDRGEALIAKMDAELAEIPAPRGPRPLAAYYQRRGFLTGTGTLVDEIMQRAGFDNLAARLNRPSVTRMPLELIVQAHPDYLILETDADALPDNGTALLEHPALSKTVPPERRLFIPQATTVCGGPFYPEAIKILRAQRP
jgi:iron complex transport system substrate-binding protein